MFSLAGCKKLLSWWNPYSLDAAQRKRLLGIDCVRGLAIFMMVLAHNYEMGFGDAIFNSKVGGFLATIVGIPFVFFGSHRQLFLMCNIAIGFYRLVTVSYDRTAQRFRQGMLWKGMVLSLVQMIAVSPMLMFIDIMSQANYWIRENGSKFATIADFQKYFKEGIVFMPDAIGGISINAPIIVCGCGIVLSVLDLVMRLIEHFHTKVTKKERAIPAPVAVLPEGTDVAEYLDENEEMRSWNWNRSMLRIRAWIKSSRLTRMFMWYTLVMFVASIIFALCAFAMNREVIHGLDRYYKRHYNVDHSFGSGPGDWQVDEWQVHGKSPFKLFDERDNGIAVMTNGDKTFNVPYTNAKAFGELWLPWLLASFTNWIFGFTRHWVAGVFGCMIGFMYVLFIDETLANKKGTIRLAPLDRFRFAVVWYFVTAFCFAMFYVSIRQSVLPAFYGHKNTGGTYHGVPNSVLLDINKPERGTVTLHPAFAHYLGKIIDNSRPDGAVDPEIRETQWSWHMNDNLFVNFATEAGMAGSMIMLLSIYEFSTYAARKPHHDSKGAARWYNPFKRVPVQWLRRFSTYSATMYCIDQIIGCRLMHIVTNVWKMNGCSGGKCESMEGGAIMYLIAVPITFYLITLGLDLIRIIPTFDGILAIANHIVAWGIHMLIPAIFHAVTGTTTTEEWKKLLVAFPHCFYPRLYANLNNIQRVDVLHPMYPKGCFAINQDNEKGEIITVVAPFKQQDEEVANVSAEECPLPETPAELAPVEVAMSVNSVNDDTSSPLSDSV